MCCVLTEGLSCFIDTLAYNSIYVTVILSGDEQHKRPVHVAELRRVHCVWGVVVILITEQMSTKLFVRRSIFTVRIPTTCSDQQNDPQERVLISYNPFSEDETVSRNIGIKVSFVINIS